MGFEKVKEYFKLYNLDKKIRIFDSSISTVNEAAELIGCDIAKIAKTLSFKVNNEIILIVLCGDKKIDSSKFKNIFNTKMKMLKAEEVFNSVGYKVGGVCPFLVKKNIKIYLDESLKRFNIVYPSCGSYNTAIELTIKELEKHSKFLSYIDISK